MSYNQFHKTVASSNQVHLYEITIGSETTYYTSAELSIVIGGNTYVPLPGLASTEVNNTGEAQRNEVTINLPLDVRIAVYLIQFIPTTEITLAIYSLERDDPDEELIHEWSGVYVRYEANNPIFKMTFAPFDRELARDALSTSFGVDCQWTQYDLNCGLNPINFRQVGSVVSKNGLSIETDLTLNTPSDTHYLGGYIEVTGTYGEERAWIIAQSGANTVEIDRDLPALLVGADIRVVSSCRGDFDRCKDPDLFDNKQRFMGAPHANKLNMFTSDVRGDN